MSRGLWRVLAAPLGRPRPAAASSARPAVTVTVTYGCCGAHYTAPMSARQQSALATGGVGDTLVALAGAMHDTQHPDCGTGTA